MATKLSLIYPAALSTALFFAGPLIAAESNEAFRQKNFDELEFETGGCQSFLKEQQAQIDKFKGTATKAIKAIRDKNAKISELEQMLAAKSAEPSPVAQSCDSESEMISRLTSEIATLGKENSELAIELAELKSKAAKNTGATAAQSAQLNALVAQLQTEITNLRAKNTELANANASLISAAQSSAASVPAAQTSTPALVNTASLRKINVTSITATSRFHNNSAKNAIDGKNGTFWFSNNNQVQGQSLSLEFEQEQLISKVNISVPQAGKNKLQLKRVLLVFPDGSTQAFVLPEKWGTHRIDIQPKKAKSFSIEIEELYPQKNKTPNKYISISEIDVLGT